MIDWLWMFAAGAVTMVIGVSCVVGYLVWRCIHCQDRHLEELKRSRGW